MIIKDELPQYLDSPNLNDKKNMDHSKESKQVDIGS